MHIWDQGTVTGKVFSKYLRYMQNPLWHSRVDDTKLLTTCLEKSELWVSDGINLLVL